VKNRIVAVLPFLVSLCIMTGCHMIKADPHVAFLGDSITQGWYYPTVNLGVHGNTTAQMLARYPRLIHGQGYKTVVILGGTNDVLLGINPDETIQNLEKISQLTLQEHAEPILCEVPPIFHGIHPDDGKDYEPAVNTLNLRIAQLASTRHWKLVDFNTPLAGHRSYSSDGVHMKTRGYLVMEQSLIHQLSPL
jgi:acyl-CoA thioesterase I